MSGRNRTMLILAAILVVLGGITYYLSANPATPPAAQATPTVVVFDYTSGTAQGLTVQSPTSTLTLQYNNGHWHITAPLIADADDLQVSQEANQLKAPNATLKVTDNATNLATYGLDPPAITATLVLSGVTPPQQQLLIGRANVDSSGYYVRQAGKNTVYLISNSLVEPLKTWLTAPPLAQPTATPLAATIVPAPTITGTLPLSGTNSLPATVPGAGAATALPGTPGNGLAGTPVITGTEPAPGASPISTLPSTGAGASPVPGGAGGGTGIGTGTVITPTP